MLECMSCSSTRCQERLHCIILPCCEYIALRAAKMRMWTVILTSGGLWMQAMGSNYFLWIIVIVSILAVLSWALGYI